MERREYLLVHMCACLNLETSGCWAGSALVLINLVVLLYMCFTICVLVMLILVP